MIEEETWGELGKSRDTTRLLGSFEMAENRSLSVNCALVLLHERGLVLVDRKAGFMEGCEQGALEGCWGL